MGMVMSRDSFEQDTSNLLHKERFTRGELRRIWTRFHRLSKGQPKLAKTTLLNVPELTMNPLAVRVVSTMSEGDYITFPEFVAALASFSVKAPVEESLAFVFRVYDEEGRGQLTSKILYDILKSVVGDELPDTQINEIACLTIADLDTNNDGIVSYQEFCDALGKSQDLKSKFVVKF